MNQWNDCVEEMAKIAEAVANNNRNNPWVRKAGHDIAASIRMRKLPEGTQVPPPPPEPVPTEASHVDDRDLLIKEDVLHDPTRQAE